MELLQQLFLTVFAAFVFSMLIVKFVSVAINEESDQGNLKTKMSRDLDKVSGNKTVMEEELKLNERKGGAGSKGKSKRKGKKKVRFAVDDEVFVVSKVVEFDLEAPKKHEVVKRSYDLQEVMVFKEDGSPVKSPEVGFSGVGNQSDQENVEMTKGGVVEGNDDCLLDSSPVADEDVDKTVELVTDDMNDDDKAGMELVNDSIIDDRTGEREGENVEGQFCKSEGTIIPGVCELCEDRVLITDEGQICTKPVCDYDEEEEKERLIWEKEDCEDDWEGIERSELEKMFALAANFATFDEHLQSLGREMQMQLFGLHKVATEGPCHEAQPMALKVYARAKCDGGADCARNAWQKLGNMSPDVAMEQYISLLSEKVPGWSQVIQSPEVNFSYPNVTSCLDVFQESWKKELTSSSHVGDPIGVSDSVNEDNNN